MCDLNLQNVKLNGARKNAFIIRNIALSQTSRFTAEIISEYIRKNYSIDTNIGDVIDQLEALRECGYLNRSFPNYYCVKSMIL